MKSTKCSYCLYKYERRRCTNCFNFDLFEWKWLKLSLVVATFAIGVAAVFLTSEAVADVLGVPVEVPRPVETDCE